MKKEDKELLLKDLCGRLPYSTIVYAQNSIDWFESELCTQVISDLINEDYIIKPYLFPLWRMTKKQKEEFDALYWEAREKTCTDFDFKCVYSGIKTDWLNKNYFDYRGLIGKGLAIDSTNLNIY